MYKRYYLTQLQHPNVIVSSKISMPQTLRKIKSKNQHCDAIYRTTNILHIKGGVGYYRIDYFQIDNSSELLETNHVSRLIHNQSLSQINQHSVPLKQIIRLRVL